MTDPVQTILLLIILVLSVLLFILGIQTFFVLKDVRETLAKANKVLDDAGQITESVSGPVSSLASILMGVKTGLIASKLIGGGEKKGKGK